MYALRTGDPAEPTLRSTFCALALRAEISHRTGTLARRSLRYLPFAPLALMLALVPLCSAFAPGLSVAPRAPRTAPAHTHPHRHMFAHP